MEIVITLQHLYKNGQYTRTISVTSFHRIYLENEYNSLTTEHDVLDVIDTSVIYRLVGTCKEIVGEHIKEILKFFNSHSNTQGKRTKKLKTDYLIFEQKKADPIFTKK